MPWIWIESYGHPTVPDGTPLRWTMGAFVRAHLYQVDSAAVFDMKLPDGRVVAFQGHQFGPR